MVQSRARPQTGLLLRAKNCKLFGSAQSAEKRQRKNDPRKLTLSLTLTRTLTLTLTLTPTLTLALHLTLALTLTPNLKLTLTRTLVKTIEKSFTHQHTHTHSHTHTDTHTHTLTPPLSPVGLTFDLPPLTSHLSSIPARLPSHISLSPLNFASQTHSHSHPDSHSDYSL